MCASAPSKPSSRFPRNEMRPVFYYVLGTVCSRGTVRRDHHRLRLRLPAAALTSPQAVKENVASERERYFGYDIPGWAREEERRSLDDYFMRIMKDDDQRPQTNGPTQVRRWRFVHASAPCAAPRGALSCTAPTLSLTANVTGSAPVKFLSCKARLLAPLVGVRPSGVTRWL